MTKRVGSAEAKAQLSALVAEVAQGHQQIIIERRGKPVAALVSVSDLEGLEEVKARSIRPRGALALVGAWRTIDDEEVDALVREIYLGRENDTGRQVDVGG